MKNRARVLICSSVAEALGSVLRQEGVEVLSSEDAGEAADVDLSICDLCLCDRDCAKITADEARQLVDGRGAQSALAVLQQGMVGKGWHSNNPLESGQPVVSLPALEPDGDAAPPAAASQDSHSRAILVVSADEAACAFIAQLAGKAGFRVDIAALGSAALKMAPTTSYEIMLCDHELPDITGICVVEWVLALAPNTRAVLMVAQFSAEDAVVFEKLGGSGHLAKPLSEQALLTVLHPQISLWTTAV